MMPTNLLFIILFVHLPSAVSAFLLICVHHKLFFGGFASVQASNCPDDGYLNVKLAQPTTQYITPAAVSATSMLFA